MGFFVGFEFANLDLDTGLVLALPSLPLASAFCKGRNVEDSSEDKLDEGKEEKSRTFLMNCWLTEYFSFSLPPPESIFGIDPFPLPAMV